MVAASWHQIDVQLTRRADLVGNLVEVVKGYAAHERGLFDEVTAARTAISATRNPSQAGQASGELENVLTRLLAIAENYPDLKASGNFGALQSQLQEIETSLASARQIYNESVRVYNTACQSFPANMFAQTFGFSTEEYFIAAAASEQRPQVQF
jgi:LemA protein